MGIKQIEMDVVRTIPIRLYRRLNLLERILLPFIFL